MSPNEQSLPVATQGPGATAVSGTPSTPDQPILDIRGLSVTYRGDVRDAHAVRNVDVALYPGKILGLCGESGCGKSTLAYGAVRLLRPPAIITAGAVTYHGRRAAAPVDVLAATPAQLRRLRWREIAIVFQSAMNALNPVLRIEDQIGDVISAHTQLSREQIRDRCRQLIEMVGIQPERLRAYPHELSGGMRQRVMIAMALALEPEVVIMDEPTTGLDVVVQREILREAMQLREQIGFAMLFITHDLSLLLEVADEVSVMYAGEVVETAEVSAIRAGGSHPYTRGLLRSFPRLRGPRTALSGIPGSPPDLRGDLHGCPFHPRCDFARDACLGLDMQLRQAPDTEVRDLTACPFVGGLDSPRQRPTHAPTEDVDARERYEAEPVDATTGQSTPVLSAVGLGKEFTAGTMRNRTVVAAVKNVNIELHRGKVVALVGESGSGKSTVAKLLAGQTGRTHGEILLDGTPIDPCARAGFRAYKSEVQMVFQDPFASLNPLHSVRYHLERALAIHASRTGHKPTEAEVDRLLGQARLQPSSKYRDAYPHELSGGQRQRVSIARALAAEPKVLLADEPVSMLDVSIRLEILDLIGELRDRYRLAILYITHDIASARYFADELLVMHHGEIVERGTAEAVVQNPADPYTRLLIESSPDPDTFDVPQTAGLLLDADGKEAPASGT